MDMADHLMRSWLFFHFIFIDLLLSFPTYRLFPVVSEQRSFRQKNRKTN